MKIINFNADLYFSPFLGSFFISVFLTAILIWFSRRISFLRKRKTLRLGGISLILSFVTAVLLNEKLFISPSLWGILIATGIILILGIWDDFRRLDWKTQLFLQIAIVVLVFIFGVRVSFITNPLGGYIFLNVGKYLWPSLFLTIFWILLIMNSMNWLDGIDGLAGGVSFIGAITIFFLSLKPEVNQPPVGIITMVLAGALLGFLIFNFYPARILAGTSGAWFMGFILATLSIFAGTKIATALLVLSLPIIDAVWVIGERLKAGESIFKGGDKKHLHYKLLKLGWSGRKIALVYYVVTLIVAVVALNTRAIGKLITILVVVLILTVFIFMISKKTKLIK